MAITIVEIKDIRENLKHALQKPLGKTADFPEFLVMNYRLGERLDTSSLI